ncbi:MAG: SDR family NAD(P)-dependent oxidoreductase [Candidatus Izemoplasmatales bacterium]|jgi:NAD(P)-dependent dehydrogenase (short-subunit alcohol dehydrogenase family)
MRELLNKTVLITGATSGIGLATAKQLLREGYSVIGVGSLPERCEAAKQTILAEMPDADITFFSANLSVLKEVSDLGKRIGDYLKTEKQGKLYCLINNAGGVRTKYQTTPEGFEYTFALNHLSGFLLSYLMVPYLMKGIIIFTSSYAHYHTKIHWHDIMYQKWYFVLPAYKQSKLANVMTAKTFNDKLANLGIRSFAVDPGLVRTTIGEKGMKGIALWAWLLRKRSGTSADVPAKTYLFLCKNSQIEGLYFKNSKAVNYNHQVDNNDQTERLFALSEKMCNISFDKYK